MDFIFSIRDSVWKIIDKLGTDIFTYIVIGVFALFFLLTCFCSGKGAVWQFILMLLSGASIALTFGVFVHIDLLDMKGITIASNFLPYWLIAIVVSALFLLISFFILIGSARRKKRFKKTVKKFLSDPRNEIYAILTLKHKYYKLTDKFYKECMATQYDNFGNIIEPTVVDKNWKKNVKEVKLFNSKTSYSKIKAFFKKTKDAANIDVTFFDGRVGQYRVYKAPMYSKGTKLVGYIIATVDHAVGNNQVIYMNQETVTQPIIVEQPVQGFQQAPMYVNPAETSLLDEDNNQFIDGVPTQENDILVWFNLLGETMCYFDAVKNVYVLTQNMASLISTPTNELTIEQLREYVFEEDLANYDIHGTLDDKVARFAYRLNTVVGPQMFEESTLQFQGKAYFVVRCIEQSGNQFVSETKEEEASSQEEAVETSEETEVVAQPKVAELYTRDGLISDINDLYKKYSVFGIVFVSIPKVNELRKTGNKSLADSIVFEYTNALANCEAHYTKVYEMFTKEYAILLSSLEEYEKVVSELKNNSSILLGTTIATQGQRFELKNKVGAVSSKSVKFNAPNLLVAAGMEALSISKNTGNPNSFNEYRPKKSTAYNFDSLK